MILHQNNSTEYSNSIHFRHAYVTAPGQLKQETTPQASKYFINLLQ